MTLAEAFIWFLVTLPVLVLLERWMTRHLQGLLLLLLRDESVSTMVFSLLFLPGVFLHEASHWVTAKLLQVDIGTFSVMPERQPDGKLRMGYVETAKVDKVRESLIGAAPLVVGCAAIVAIGYWQLNIDLLGVALMTGEAQRVIDAVQLMLTGGDVLLWLLLIFILANSMMPSESDRRAWPFIAAVLVMLGLLIYFLRVGNVVLTVVGPLLTQAFQFLALAFTITIVVNLLIMPLVLLGERLLSTITRTNITYH